ncbi:MAG: GAF domain-containing protein, partial [Rhodospirillales bacterium]
MSTLAQHLRFPFRVHLSFAFISLALVVGGVTAFVAFVQAESIVTKLSTDTFKRIADQAVLKTAEVFAPGEAAVGLAAASHIVEARGLDERLAQADFMLAALESSPTITSVFIGYRDGDFILFRRLPDAPALRAGFDAPEGTAYVAQSIERSGGEVTGTYVYLGRNRAIIERRDRPDYVTYDPRKRPWYAQALDAVQQIKTAPYIFFTTGEVGTTLAMKAVNGGAVVAADITLNSLAEALQSFKVTPGTDLALVTQGGKMVAYLDPAKVMEPAKDGGKPRQADVAALENKALAETYKAFANGKAKDPVLVADRQIDGLTWRTMATSVPLGGGSAYILALAAPTSELLADVNRLINEAAVWLMMTILVILPFTLYLGRRMARPLNALVKETEAIKRFDFSQPLTVHSAISDVDELAEAMGGMKNTIRQFLDISKAIADEEDFDQLLDLLVDETIAATHAEGGVIYLLDDEEANLIPSVIRDNSRDILPIALPNLTLDDLGKPFAEAVQEKKVALCQIDPTAEQEDQARGLIRFVQEIDQGTCQVVAVPLSNRGGELIGVLALFMSGKVDVALLSFVNALSGTAAVSIETRRLIEAQKALFESFIKMIAGAIDAKSAYTGGHCERVPELTKMLADAAVKTKTGPYQDFALSNSDWEAIHIASWLHDCGKVTTPEFVVDKATKLETIYDRIHEIRMRFEVLKRDAHITYWENI